MNRTVARHWPTYHGLRMHGMDGNKILGSQKRITDSKSEFIFQNPIFYIYSKEWLHTVAFQI